MYINNKNHSKVVGNIKIELGECLGLEKKEDAYIELRDMNMEEAIQFKVLKDDEAEQYRLFASILPGLMVNHDFYEVEDQKMSNEAVVELLKETWLPIQYIYGVYLPFMFRRTRRK